MRATLFTLIVIAVLQAFDAAALDTVPEVPIPKSWENFVILPWQLGEATNVIKDKAVYESVNIHGFHIDRRNDNLQQFARETKWPYYVDHTADKGYLHLGNKADQVSRKKEIIVRPNSLVDPATIATMKEHIRANVTSAKGSSVVAYALDDEISLGNFCSPAEVDGSPASVAGYRKFLEKMYSKIEKLNAEYGTSFTNFSEINPESFEKFRGQLKPDAIGAFNLSQWCDWRSYMDTQFAECLEDLCKYANGLDPNTPCGFVGGQTPNCWGGYDYRKLCKAVQWMEAYDMGGNNEILHSFWTQKRPHVQTYFSSKNPKLDTWYLWYYVCHGNRGVICWPFIDAEKISWFKDGKAADFIDGCKETYKEVQGPVGKKIIDGEFVHDPVAIYYSHPSIQMTWAMDAATHGGTWPNRSSSMDNTCGTSHLTRVGWLKTLEDVGIQANFIHMDHLLDGVLTKDNYKVLFLNRVLCLSDAEADAIKAFSAKGGVVIADHLCGIFDEHGKARKTGALDDIFGVKHDLSKGILGGKTLTEVDAERDYGSFSKKNWAVEDAPVYKEMPVFERGLAAEGKAKAEFSANGSAAVVRNGKNVYLNLSPAGYLLKRPTGDSKDWAPFVAQIFKEAGIEPRLKLSADNNAAYGLESIFWKNGARTTLCIVKNLGRQASISGFGSADANLGQKVRLKLTFAKPVKELKNERTGKDLGNGAQFEDDFTPWEANVYTYTP